MDFMTAVHTDVGIKKSTNQDSVLLKIARTDFGKVVLCAVCDGMGGLAKGELASATLLKGFSEWFEKTFPEMLYNNFQENQIYESWNQLIQSINQKVMSYGNRNGVSLGTTAAVFLIAADRYYIVNVGDSRVYEISNQIIQLTKDQTYVQREIDNGNMTEEQAKTDPQRNVLLQCVGASTFIEPEFFSGEVHADTVFMLCSDGFRHTISAEELYGSLNPSVLKNEQIMYEKAVGLTELNKDRRESDNISVALIRTC